MMDLKEEKLLNLLGEIHRHCTSNGILYYLDEKSRAAYSPTICMDADNIRKFIKTFHPADNRYLEWMGNNYRFANKQLRYIDEDTLYYTEERLFSESHLGMFVTIDTQEVLTGKIKRIEKVWKKLDSSPSTRRSGILNSSAAAIHKKLSSLTSGKKITNKQLKLVNLNGVEFYVLKKSSNFDNPEEGFVKAIKKKANVDNFFCDAEISYKEMNLDEERKNLYKIHKSLSKENLKVAVGERQRSTCSASVDSAFYRYNYAVELIQKYGYDELMENGDKDPIKPLLDEYIKIAEKYRNRKMSLYIGDKFTAVLNKHYSKLDTNKLYKYTPEFYKEGLEIRDYKGNIISKVGGQND